MPLTLFRNSDTNESKQSSAYRASITQDTEGLWSQDSEGFWYAIFDGSVPDNGVAGLVFARNFNSMMINCYSTNGLGGTQYVMEYQLLQKQLRAGANFDVIPMTNMVTHVITPQIGGKQYWNSNVLFTNDINKVVSPVMDTTAQSGRTPFSEFQYKIANGTNVISEVVQHSGIVGNVNDALLSNTGNVQEIEYSTQLYVRFKALGTGSQAVVLNFACTTT